jgi:hypothetical protein
MNKVLASLICEFPIPFLDTFFINYKISNYKVCFLLLDISGLLSCASAAYAACFLLQRTVAAGVVAAAAAATQELPISAFRFILFHISIVLRH